MLPPKFIHPLISVYIMRLHHVKHYYLASKKHLILLIRCFDEILFIIGDEFPACSAQ